MEEITSEAGRLSLALAVERVNLGVELLGLRAASKARKTKLTPTQLLNVEPEPMLDEPEEE